MLFNLPETGLVKNDTFDESLFGLVAPLWLQKEWFVTLLVLLVKNLMSSPCCGIL